MSASNPYVRNLPKDVVHTNIVEPLLDELSLLEKNITQKENLLANSEQNLMDNPPGSYPPNGNQFKHFTEILPEFINELQRDLVNMRAQREILKTRIQWLVTSR